MTDEPDLFDPAPDEPPLRPRRRAAAATSATGARAPAGALAGAPSDASSRAPTSPLAERLRPHDLDSVIGQSHLLGPGKPLRVAFESGRPHSMILWGPPGVGKTTLARLMADGFDAQFIAISAVLGGVKEIREAVPAAEHARRQGRRT
ncbi:MAG: AAA family ATPase, partial [Burkholderiaceae bacterium]